MLPISAVIQENAPGDEVGAHYNVRLAAIPAVGERIRLWSSVDAKAGTEPYHFYSVTSVSHVVHDIDVNENPVSKGNHEITIHVDVVPFLKK